MRTHMGALLQAGLALKLNQLKRAVGDYASDRAVQGQSIVASFAVAAGLYAAAGIFVIGALFIGVVALFRYLEIKYGMFEALGGCAGALLILAAISAAIASSHLKRPAASFPALGARLGHAMSTNPIIPKQDQPKQRIAAAARQKAADKIRDASPSLLERVTPETVTSKAGLVAVAGLLAWALARRRQIAQLQRSAHPAGKRSRARA